MSAAPRLSLEEQQRAHAAPDLRRFALLAASLAVLALAARALHPSLFPVAVAALAGFTVHYWLPFSLKQPAFIALSILGGAYVMGAEGGAVSSAGGTMRDAVVAVGLTVVAGLAVWAVLAAPLPYWARFLLVVALFAAIMQLGAHRAGFHLPPRTFQVFGAVFMLGIFPYLHEVKHQKRRTRLVEFARFFFVLPTFRMIAPILDYQKLGQSFYKRDVHLVARQGLLFLTRGAVQFAIYEVAKGHVYYALNATDARSPRLVAAHLVFAYALYLRTSGMIHMFLGVMNLFGWDLPECYRWFSFSHSPLDFWRRANIYFKDAMTKVVFMPIYFALRKRSDLGAKLVAIGGVFAGSWFVHIWVVTWYSDLHKSLWSGIIGWPQEALFWTGVGVASAGNLVLEHRAEQRKAAARPARRAAPPPIPEGVAGLAERLRRHLVERIGLPQGMSPLRGALQIAAMQLFIAALFSLEHAPSVRAWLLTMKWWS